MKKNIAIIGYGGQGGWHAMHALKSDVLTLVGVYDIKPERCELARSRGIKAYGSADEIFADPAVDIVTIATPNDVHKDLVIRALAAGKHVVCEKPVEMSVAALDEMLDAAKAAKGLFTVHQNRRWDVDFLAVKELIASGKIGAPIRIESRIHGSRGIPSDWRCLKQYGGGMILDWGVHLIDQMLQLIPNDTVTGIYCETTAITKSEVDDGFRLSLTFASGKTAFVEVGTYNFIAMPRFYAQFEKGTAMIEDWQKNMQVVKCKYWHENEVLPVQTAAGITKTMAPRDEVTVDTFEWTRPTSDVHDFYRNFTAAIDGKAEMLIKPGEIRRVMQVMEGAFESAEKKQALSVSI
ncbi:MAG: Gfo/Idh/MocA family oxidoreductase [Clostridia bacterium]|nr:Gfo/Idh/MocA family oxidoreductase [Clostridia bacterium]